VLLSSENRVVIASVVLSQYYDRVTDDDRRRVMIITECCIATVGLKPRRRKKMAVLRHDPMPSDLIANQSGSGIFSHLYTDICTTDYCTFFSFIIRLLEMACQNAGHTLDWDGDGSNPNPNLCLCVCVFVSMSVPLSVFKLLLWYVPYVLYNCYILCICVLPCSFFLSFLFKGHRKSLSEPGVSCSTSMSLVCILHLWILNK